MRFVPTSLAEFDTGLWGKAVDPADLAVLYSVAGETVCSRDAKRYHRVVKSYVEGYKVSGVWTRGELRDLLVSMLGREVVVPEMSRAFCAIGTVGTVDPKAGTAHGFQKLANLIFWNTGMETHRLPPAHDH